MIRDETYIHSLEDLAEGIALQEREVRKNKKFQELQMRSRELLERVTGIPQDKVLIIYGEQADPPIIKNTGKGFLAAIIEKQLMQRGYNAQSTYLALFNDIFGSNAGIFTSLGLLTDKQASRAGRQTYTFAPITSEYLDNVIKAITLDHPQRQNQLTQQGLGEQEIRALAKNASLGEFNVRLRLKLEEPTTYQRPCTPLSAFEDAVIKDEYLREQFISFSKFTGKGIPFYVVWKTAFEDAKKLDSGYRKYPVLLERKNLVTVQNPEGPSSNHVLKRCKLEELFKDPRAHQFTLNAGSKAALMYTLTIPGVCVTGGGSTYNEDLAEEFEQAKYPKPLLTHISDPEFRIHGKRFAFDLISKAEEIQETLENTQDIQTTDDRVFRHLAAWRAP